MQPGSSRTRSLARLLLPLGLILGWLLASACGGGGGAEPPKGAANSWDNTSWDSGTWQ